jgi:hypothetical protein
MRDVAECGMASAAARRRSTPVGVELGGKRVFAWAVDWPGWARSGKTEEQALEALASYASRYAVVAKEAGIKLPARAGEGFEVVERVKGSGATDFGIPHEVVEADAAPLRKAEAERQGKLVAASWAVLDRVVDGAPAELRKGPRGGGRDRDKIVDHVLGAEAAYARKLGVKHPQPARDDAEAVAALREEVLATLRAPSDGTASVPKGWPPRYAARRIAWHVLDHAWEIEDRSEPAG